MKLVLILIILGVAPAVAQNAGLVEARAEQERLEKVVSANPADAVAQYRLGLAYRELGDNRRATQHLQMAMRGGFNNLAVKLHLIEAAFACRESVLALETAKQLIATAQKSADVQLRIGRLLFDHLFYQESLKAFQLALQAAPDSFEARVRLALTHYLLKDYAATVAAIEPIKEASPEVASLKASAQAKLGHFDEATALLRATLSAAPQSPHAYVNLALIELDRGHVEEAEAVLERFRGLRFASDAKVFYAAGRDACGEIASALEQAKAPMSFERAKADFYYGLAEQLQERFNFSSAVQLARLAQVEEGNSARVLLLAGAGCVNRDPLSPQPVVFLRAALAHDPRLDQAYFLLGRIYTRQGKLQDASDAYQKAVELKPSAAYCVRLGKALADRQKAILEFQRALALDPSYAEANLELGRAYGEAQDANNARRNLEKAIELEPDYYEAYYLLGRLLHKLGEEDRSRELLAQFKQKKDSLMEQSVIDAGYIGNGN